ncbi:MAG: glyceraldehyde 3-phosphate dehydrogenase NAD-binding domain-containing protein [Campylobacterota bacterium]|nr:glyceraldehyde 3-phosphate dehydrogenase NAD-binding domain-containing protein [Campylobacterota bacterium]
MNILINGIGRIGKSIIRQSLNNDNFNVIAINELNTNIDNIAYSINYDTTYGNITDKFEVKNNFLVNTTDKIEVLNYSSILQIKNLDIDYIIDASGSKVDTNELKLLDVKAIFLTHPNKKADINIILGVNEEKLSNEHKVISTSSCNATALLPILKIIDDNYSIKSGDITTIHPLLNHQKVLDSGCVGNLDRDVDCNYEFGRSSLANIIPSKTTTIDACSYVDEKINKDIFSSSSLRVPTDTVGVINVTIFLDKECTKDELLSLCKNYRKNQKFDIILNNCKPLVSSDFKGEKYTTIIDHRFTDIKNNNMVKLVLWYDNEWGYASKVIGIVEYLDKKI